MNDVDVLYVRAGGPGWGPIDELATLCSRLLGGTLTTLSDRGEVSPARKVAGMAPRRRARRRSLLVIASNPAHLAYATRRAHWFPGYRTTVAWVIDSFWTDRISRIARGRGHFDHIFVTDRDLIDEWRAVTGTQVHWAPWGPDTLATPDINGPRPTDLVRIGRQPGAWDDDDRTIRAAAELGLVVEGRPPIHPDSRANQHNVRAALARSKFVLAFSNLLSPAPYTHPTREYLTGRWTDALGAGATVAGAAPESAAYTLWPGATAPLDPHDLTRGLEQLRHLVDSWSADTPSGHHEHARAVLDWRWRIVDIAEALEAGPHPVLEAELRFLKRVVDNG